MTIYCIDFNTESPTVVIDGYTHNSTLSSEDPVPLGTPLILVCQVVGLPYGTPLSYTWTCPNGPCELEGYYGRTVYNEHILAVNITSTSDGGTYTCQVTATKEQLAANANFTLNVTGKQHVRSVTQRAAFNLLALLYFKAYYIFFSNVTVLHKCII